MRKNVLDNVFNEKVDALGLSVFRMLYALVLFCEIIQLFKFRHIIYDKEPFQYIGEIDVNFIFFFWFVVLGFLFLGLFTRFSTILNYIFGVIVFSSAKKFECHIFYIYVNINFLLLFIPVSRVFSIDSLIKKIKYTSLRFQYVTDRKVLEINYLAIVFCSIALVYFDSVFLKLSSPMWMNGLGMWLPSSLPMMTWNDTSVLLNQEGLIKFLGYFVIGFEALFIFSFWFKRLRVPLLLIGILFHIGILVIYPIPWFALTVIVAYLLMLPESFWLKISKLFKSKKYSYTFYYDALCPLCVKVVAAIQQIDFFNRINTLSVQENATKEKAFKNISEDVLLINIHGVNKNGKIDVGYEAYRQLLKHLIYTYPLALFLGLPGISFIGKKIYKYIAGERLTNRCYEENCQLTVYEVPLAETQDILVKGWSKLNITKVFWKVLLLLIFIFQCLVIWTTPLIQSRISKNNPINQIEHLIYYKSKFWTKNFLGITRHTVFLNEHFYNYTHIYKVTFLNKKNEEVLVPIVDNNGMLAKYISGPTWTDYAFGISYSMLEFQTNQTSLEKGFASYLIYFIKDEKIRENNLKFKFYVKDIDKPSKWEKDFLRKQIKKPWQEAGLCKIENGQVNYYWNKKMDSVFNNIR